MKFMAFLMMMFLVSCGEAVEFNPRAASVSLMGVKVSAVQNNDIVSQKLFIFDGGKQIQNEYNGERVKAAFDVHEAASYGKSETVSGALHFNGDLEVKYVSSQCGKYHYRAPLTEFSNINTQKTDSGGCLIYIQVF